MTKATDTHAMPSLAGAEWLTRPPTRAVFAALAATGHPVRAVGGAVRNALLGLPVTDIDLATPARPEAVIMAAHRAGLKAIPTGIAHGTVTDVSESRAYEVTTLRRDLATDGRHATVAFTDDWAEDARRRDFTINALFCDADGTVHDPLGGRADVTARRVRFIGDAEARITEDHLRILRFFRLHAAYGHGTLDVAGLAACVRGRDGLARLSAERIRAEVLKLLVAPGAVDAIAAMTDCGLLCLILRVAPRPGVLRQAVAAEAALGRAPDVLLRLSALALAVAEDIPRLSDRLRLSHGERDRLLVIEARAADTFANFDAAAVRRHLYRTGLEPMRRQIVALASLGPGQHSLALHLEVMAAAGPAPQFPLAGRDVLALGLPAGPGVGRLLAEIEAWWVASEFPSEGEVRGRLAALIAARKGSSS